MITKPNGLILDFIQVASISGLDLSENQVVHELLLAPHKPPALPKGKQAVYVFSLREGNSRVLKVGRVGPNSGPRFQSQHYDPRRAKSTLAASLLSKVTNLAFMAGVNLDDGNIGEWICHHTDRDHFFLDSDHASVVLSLLEVFMQARLNPLFEG